MTLSIIVPALDEAAHLGDSLAALAPLREQGHEVIVVDGGSRDASPSIAQKHADRVLRAPRGRAVQMNTGASIARHDTLLFLHADCRLPPLAAEAIASVRDAGMRWGRFDVALDGKAAALPLVAAAMNRRSRLTGISTGDQGLFVERALFDSIGGYPPLPLMEDVAMCERLKHTGGPPACLDARMRVSGRRWDTHGAWRTIASMWALRFAWWRGADAGELARRYYGAVPFTAPVLKVFAKAPLPGRVKSRLAATIGAEAAADAYRTLALRTLAVAAAARRAGVAGEIELWFAPEPGPGALAVWAERFGASLHAQQGRDLGERMQHALRTSLDGGRAALLIGTDAPGIDVPYLAAAASALQASDAVLGPAADGGYVLIGLARGLDVFRDIAWSTAEVLAATRDRLRDAGASWQELNVLWDVDTHEDFVRWQADVPDPAAIALYGDITLGR